MFLTFGLEFLRQEQLHPKTLKKILRKTVCAPLPTPLVLTLQSKMVVNRKTKILATQTNFGISHTGLLNDTIRAVARKSSFTPVHQMQQQRRNKEEKYPSLLARRQKDSPTTLAILRATVQ